MNKQFVILTIGFMAILTLTPVYVAWADDDYIEARRLYDSGKILPLEAILKQVRQTYPGKILELELERENGRIVYEIEILSEEGLVTEIYVDAITGQLLSAEEDD